MAQQYDKLNPSHIEFIQSQQMFFVATAPDQGRINLSPKGLDSFHVMDANRAVFMNLTGSGNETAAHLIDNGRITLMFCSFSGAPMILRLYGKGRVVHHTDSTWDELCSKFPDLPGRRQFIEIEIEMVQTSCGCGVPLYEYTGQRDELVNWLDKQGEAGVKQYWEKRNTRSIDGLDTYIPVDK